MSDLKNIIVIGGHTFVNTLAPSLPASYRILLIERSEFILWAPTVVRAVVVPGWESKNLTARLTQESVFPADSRHRVVCPNAVVELKKTSVVLEHPFEGKTEISFDKCIIATGAQQPPPMRPVKGSSLEEYKALLRRMQGDIRAASKFLMVGGGAVGVEIAGEITVEYPDKDVTLVHGEKGLLHPPCAEASGNDPDEYEPPHTTQALSETLQTQLKDRGVHLVLDDLVEFPEDFKPGPQGSVKTFRLRSGKTVEADYVFMSTGNTPNSALVKDADPGAVTGKGYVRVDTTFRIEASSESSPIAGEYYALGDVAAVPSSRTSVSASAEGPALAGIIAAIVMGNPPGTYVPGAMTGSILVTLGPKGGGGTLGLPLLGQVGAPGFVVNMKSKDFFGPKFFATFMGPEKVTDSA